MEPCVEIHPKHLAVPDARAVFDPSEAVRFRCGTSLKIKSAEGTQKCKLDYRREFGAGAGLSTCGDIRAARQLGRVFSAKLITRSGIVVLQVQRIGAKGYLKRRIGPIQCPETTSELPKM